MWIKRSRLLSFPQAALRKGFATLFLVKVLSESDVNWFKTIKEKHIASNHRYGLRESSKIREFGS